VSVVSLSAGNYEKVIKTAFCQSGTGEIFASLLLGNQPTVSGKCLIN
jgi:hypothetical protein